MANSYVVSSLPEYVEQRREQLIAKSVLGAKTLDYINFQTGVKGPTALNLIDFDIELQDDACGWNEAGTSTLSQRIIDAKPFRVNMAVCDKNLYGTWAQYQVKVAAGKVASDLPFEQDFVDGVLNGIQEKVEELEDKEIYIFSLRGVPLADISGVQALDDLVARLHEKDKTVYFTAVQPDVMEIFSRSGFSSRVGSDNFYWSTDRILTELGD